MVLFPRDTAADEPKLTKRQQAILDGKIKALGAWAAAADDDVLKAADHASLARSYGLEPAAALKVIGIERVRRGFTGGR